MASTAVQYTLAANAPRSIADDGGSLTKPAVQHGGADIDSVTGDINNNNNNDSGSEDGEEELPRTLGVFSGASLLIGLVIGSGIFSTPGSVVSILGGPAPAIMLWIIGALVTFTGAFSYIELGTLIPESGGEQKYLERAFTRPRAMLAFMFCFSMIVCIRPSSEAANASVFGKYIMYAAVGPMAEVTDQYILDHHLWIERGIGLFALFSIAALNMLSVKWAVRVNTVLAAVKILVLTIISISGIVVLAGATKIERQFDSWRLGFSQAPTTVQPWASALFKVLFAYDGWNNLNYALGELKNPRRNLPIAVTGGVGIVAVCYILANVAYFVVVPLTELQQSHEILAAIYCHAVFGETIGRRILPVFVALSAYGGVSSQIFGVSRIILVAARANYMPYSEFFARLHPTRGTPVNAIASNLVLALVYLLAPPPGNAFSFLVDMQGYPTYLFLGISVVGLFILRRSIPDSERPFKVWFVLPVIFILCSIFLSVFPFVPPKSQEGDPYAYYLPPLFGALFVLVGIPLYYLFVYRKDQRGQAVSTTAATASH